MSHQTTPKNLSHGNARTPKRRRLPLLLSCAALAFAFALPSSVHERARAQQRAPEQVPAQKEEDAPPPPPSEQEDVLRIDTDLVMIDVLVTDAQGRPVRNLRREDFKIYEDGEERPLAFFNVERRGGVERPVAVVFAVDVSGSMSPAEMLRLRSAMEVFADKLAERPASFALMSFGMRSKVHQSFTSDARKLSRALERLSRDINGLSTHTYDAVDDAIRLLVKQAPRTRERQLMKRAVVVITDGFPVGDTVSVQTVIERANAAEVSVYTVTLPSYSLLLASKERGPLPTPLDVSGLVEKTGGSNIYATDTNYDSLFKALAEEVTSTYVLAFYPPEEKRRDGRFHSIRVEGPRGLYLRQNRSGYKGSDK
jgi:VWFA-related protein